MGVREPGGAGAVTLPPNSPGNRCERTSVSLPSCAFTPRILQPTSQLKQLPQWRVSSCMSSGKGSERCVHYVHTKSGLVGFLSVPQGRRYGALDPHLPQGRGLGWL